MVLAILAILNIEYWHALEIRVKGYSRSLKMVPFNHFNGPYMTFYHSAIVTILCTIFKVTFKIS